jgi:hypothetical protein
LAFGFIYMMRRMQGGQAASLKSLMKRGVVSELDRLLIESEQKIAEPKGQLFVRISLTGGEAVEGRVIWADSHFIKYQSSMSGPETVVPKSNIVKLELLSQL